MEQKQKQKHQGFWVLGLPQALRERMPEAEAKTERKLKTKLENFGTKKISGFKIEIYIFNETSRLGNTEVYYYNGFLCF